MITRVLVIGGYGNFGRFITASLARDKNLQVIVAGRNPDGAKDLIAAMPCERPIESTQMDISKGFATSLRAVSPDIVIHTCGPFQGQSYSVALACIEQACHYIDLADSRSFVNDIGTLDAKAKAQGVLVLSGASSVPSLTCAIIDEYVEEFSSLERVDSAIAAAQPKEQGLATVKAILNYVGKPFTSKWNGASQTVFGWQGLRVRKFWRLNKRLLGYCDVPDLEILPQRYPTLQSVRFQAGIESRFQHFCLYLLSWLVRLKLTQTLEPLAKLLLNTSKKISWFCADESGYYLEMAGLGQNGAHKKVTFEIVARKGDGLYIPCSPSIILTTMLANKTLQETGAMPAVGVMTLARFLDLVKELKIEVRTTRA